MSATGLPSGVTASFSPNPITSTGFTVLTFAASSSATPGTYNVTVTGADGALTATTNVALTVSQPTFFIGSSVSSAGMIQGTSLSSTITILPQPGFSGDVTLAASGLPSGVTASFSQNPTATTSLVTITASASAAIGDGTIIVTGTAGTVSASTQINIGIVAPSPSFTLGLSPASLSIAQGASGSSIVSVIGENGFSANVNLTAYSLPTGVTALFNPDATTGTSTLTLTASSSAAVGTYNVIVSGTQGPGWPTESATLVLTVAATPGFTPSTATFGSVSIGTISPVQSLTYTFGNAITLGSISVLTQGATGLDFADAGSDTCVANTAYTAGQSCIVNVSFTPGFAGTRYGAAVLYDSNGNVVATDYLQGTGIGPQINFLPGMESTVASASNGLSFPYGVAVDGTGNVYIADFENNRILKETLSGGSYTQSTIPTSSLNNPESVAVDGGGNIYIADTNNSQVLKETPTAGGYTESVVASGSTVGFNYPSAVAVDGSGDVYFTTSGAGTLFEMILSAGSYTSSTIPIIGASNPVGVAVDGSGSVYIADSGNGQIFIETPVTGGYSQTLVSTSGLTSPYGLAVDGSGNVYIADIAGDQVVKETWSGGSYTQSTISTSQLNFPSAIAVDGGGNVYIADNSNFRVLKVDFADPPSLTFAGSPVGSTSTDSPKTVTIENVGNAALNISAVSYPANFPESSSATSDCAVSTSLSTNQTCTLTIDFSPLTAGVLKGQLELTDNNLNAAAPGSGTQTIALSGTGTQVTPTISWPTLAAITYGTALSAAQLNATSSAAGIFAYSPAAGAVLGAGQQTLTAIFTPTDTTDYTTASASTTLMVNPATPAITWPTPSAIISGTALSENQLNATSSTAGTFTYSPAFGAVLGIGQQTLTVTFAPTDAEDYTTAYARITLTVDPPPGFTPTGHNFGSVNIGTKSPVQSFTYPFGNAVTLGSTVVLTQGATGLDFANAGTGSCAANTAYAAGQTCTVNVTFTPKYAGTRYGAVVLNDSNGNTIATGFLQGTGVGPQINFLPNTESTVASNGLFDPNGVAVDGGGNVYIADTLNNRILKETLSGGIYTESTIPTSSLNYPSGIAVDAGGNVYIADTYNLRVVKESPSAGGYSENTILAFTAGTGNFPAGVAVDGNGNVYCSSYQATVLKATLSASGYVQSAISTSSTETTGVAVDAGGNVYVADAANDRILKETPSTGGYTESTIPTSGLGAAAAVAVDGSGNLYITDSYNDIVLKETLSASGYIQSTISTSQLDLPFGIAIDGSGNVYIADTYDFRILKEDFADAPSLTFADTVFGSTSSDSPQTVTLENVGNAALSFPVPSSGSNPSITTNFTLNSKGASACPKLSAGSTGSATLAAGASCQLPISFTPTAVGVFKGSLVLTDNNLNGMAPGYAKQSITLSGTGVLPSPTITWATPASITYGTPLSGIQLNAKASVAGTFKYSPAAGTVLGAGQQTLSVTFTPTNTAKYATTTATVTLTVNQATPTITWATPSAITYGTALSAAQLDAKSTLSGSFVYMPAVGTVLAAGTQTLSVTFTPANTTDYSTATKTVQLTVNKAAQTITFNQPKSPVTFSGTPVTQTLSANSTSGLTVTFSVVSGPATVSGSTLKITGVGTVVLSASQAGSANYLAATHVTRSITVER